MEWIKYNVDVAHTSNHNVIGYGGIFRDKHGLFLLAFAKNLNWDNSFLTEFFEIFRAIETTKDKGWLKIWVKSDPLLVVKAFSSINHYFIPWQVRNKYQACLDILNNKSFFISRIFREGNGCADFFSNIDCTSNSLTYFDSIPLDIRQDYVKNRLVLPFFRFKSF